MDISKADLAGEPHNFTTEVQVIFTTSFNVLNIDSMINWEKYYLKIKFSDSINSGSTDGRPSMPSDVLHTAGISWHTEDATTLSKQNPPN